MNDSSHAHRAAAVKKKQKRVSTMYKWRDCDMQVFLQLYRVHDCLWNLNKSSYRDRIARQAAYESIRVAFCNDHITVADIKSKIKTLRSTYNVEINKIVESKKSGTGTVYKPKLFWFKQADDFLRELIEPKKLTSPQQPHGQKQAKLRTAQTPTQGRKRSWKEEQDWQTDEEQPWKVEKEDSWHEEHSYIVPWKDASEQSQMEKEGSVGGKTSAEDENEFELFGRAVGIHLKKMPLDRAFACQEAIQKIISEERLRPHSSGYDPLKVAIQSIQGNEGEEFYETEVLEEIEAYEEETDDVH